MSETPENELGNLEKQLATLPLKPPRLDRDQVLFRAGQGSMKRGWGWPCATAATSAIALYLALALMLEPPPASVVRIVRVEVPVAQPTGAEDVAGSTPPAVVIPFVRDENLSAPLAYWRLQQQALRFGVEGLPSSESDASSAPPLNHHELSAGSRPGLDERSSTFPIGEP